MNVLCPNCSKIEFVPDFTGKRRVHCSACETDFDAIAYTGRTDPFVPAAERQGAKQKRVNPQRKRRSA